MDIIKSIEHEQLKNKIPELKIGDTVKVHVKIKEGNKERIQVFEGIIIKKQGGGVNATFTVRKISYGVGVEKTFLVHSPLVEKVLKSAIANAENNFSMDTSKLYVAEIYANQGPTMKRIRAATQGRANRIRKRTSHIEVVLKERE